MAIAELFNQAFAIDAGSSHIVLAEATGEALQREPCLISQVQRKPPPSKSRRGVAAAAPAAEPWRLLAVGSEAAQPGPADESTVRLVHPIAHGRIVDLDALELVLRKVIRAARINPLRRSLFGLRLTQLAPLHLAEIERIQFAELMRDFGFGRSRTLDAPVAAARGAGVDTSATRGQMLVDIGGGQTTLAAFSLGSIAAWHWSATGGRDLDTAITDYVLRRYRLALHPALAEHIKLALGTVYPPARPATLDIAGFDTVTGVEKKVTLDDNELRDVLIDACEPLIMAVHQSFEEVAPELAADIAQTEIVLVGGGALLAGLPQFLAERTGLHFRVAPDPINAAIRGACAAP